MSYDVMSQNWYKHFALIVIHRFQLKLLASSFSDCLLVGN